MNKLEQASETGQTVKKTPTVEVQRDGNSVTFKLNSGLAELKQTFGSANRSFILKLLRQIGKMSPQENEAEAINANLGALAGVNPRNELEGMLATQMVSVHNLAMEFMHRSILPGQTVEGAESNINRAIKLMRTFTAQVEALSKYRNQGHQRVTVQHVQVNDGGQAIVGTVHGH